MEIMEPAFLGGAVGRRWGTRLQARSLPQTELWVCRKLGVESKGQKVLQIIYIGDIFKCWLYIILRAFNSFLPGRSVDLKSILVA